VALKVLVTSVTRHEEHRRRFLSEARAAASVSHPNLAAIYDVGEVDGRVSSPWSASRDRRCASPRVGPPARRRGRGLTLQILAGLGKAHQRASCIAISNPTT